MRLYLIILSLLLPLQTIAQFGPQRNRNFSTNDSPLSTDLLVISRPGDTNYNVPTSVFVRAADLVSATNNLDGAKILTGSLTTNKIDATFYNWLTNTGGGGSGDVTQSGLAAGSYSVSGNGAGLTNVPASSIVKYISQTKPVNADSNWFGPWTPGTTTAGIQEAWDSVVKPTNAGPTARGVVFQFEGGYYYFTNTLVFSNYFPMAMTFRGANLLDTKLVYAGSEVGTNTITFKGPATPRASSLNLPLHLTVTDLGFSAINDTTNVLVTVGNYSHANFTRCNFTSWVIMTNQVEGVGVSIDGASTTGITSGSLVGLKLWNGPEHSTMVVDSFFAGLATGIYSSSDHMTTFGLKFAHIGIFTNRWPISSPYSLGACIYRVSGLESVFYYSHFYSAKLGFAYEGGVFGSCVLDRVNFESCADMIATTEDGEIPTLRDPIVYGVGAVWPFVNVLSNSPNYKVLNAQAATNTIVYGVDSTQQQAGSAGMWKVKVGYDDRLLVDSEGAQIKGRLDVTAIDGSATYINASGIMSVDSTISHSVESSGATGYLNASDGVSAPKFVVGTPTITSGAGAPSASEPNGSIYMRTDGGASTTLYIRHSGTWLAK